MSELDANRLLLQYEKLVREINREQINPRIAELKLADLKPVVSMVAKARAEYLKALFDLGSAAEEHPGPEQINRLQELRHTYEALSEGAQALEIAIERGYLDIEHH